MTTAQATAAVTDCLGDYLESAGMCADFRARRPMHDTRLQPYRRRNYGWHMGRLYADFCYAQRSPGRLEHLDPSLVK